MKKKKKNRILYIVLVLFLFITIGYAFLQRSLSINGTTYIEGNTWDIHFENIVVSPGSVSLSPGNTGATIDSNDTTTVNFNVTLKKPGDYYEFTVDAVNDGSIDAMIENTVVKLDGEEITTLPEYLDYSFKYSNGDPIQDYQLLESENFETYKVKVIFKENIDVGDLPGTSESYDFSFSIKYKQSNDNAISAH